MDDITKPVELSDWPALIQLPVQWGDQDAFGHVNNTVAIRWFESSRIDYLQRVGMDSKLSGPELAPILAAISCNYRLQVSYPDTVLIGARVKKIGRTSMVIEHIFYSQNQQAVAGDGESVVVTFDYQANQSCPIPPEIVKAIETLEKRRFNSSGFGKTEVDRENWTVE